MISVVLFDLDHTLFAHRRAVEDGVIAHLGAIGLLESDVDAPAEAERWSALEEQHYTRYLRGELDYVGQRRARASDFLAPTVCHLCPRCRREEWFENYLHEYRAALTLHDDTLPALRALARYLLGIITNCVTPFQQPKLNALGISSFFEHVSTSGDFGDGYMTEATNAVLEWPFGQGFDTILWECFPGNSESVSVARKAGFTFTGVDCSFITRRDGIHSPPGTVRSPQATRGTLSRAGRSRHHESSMRGQD